MAYTAHVINRPNTGVTVFKSVRYVFLNQHFRCYAVAIESFGWTERPLEWTEHPLEWSYRMVKVRVKLKSLSSPIRHIA